MSGEDLPPVPKNWRRRDKAMVLGIVASGRLSLTAALLRYDVSLDEYREWERRAAEGATLFDPLSGLRALYRSPARRRRR